MMCMAGTMVLDEGQTNRWLGILFLSYELRTATIYEGVHVYVWYYCLRVCTMEFGVVMRAKATQSKGYKVW